jgi:hypothetical protein
MDPLSCRSPRRLRRFAARSPISTRLACASREGEAPACPSRMAYAGLGRFYHMGAWSDGLLDDRKARSIRPWIR